MKKLIAVFLIVLFCAFTAEAKSVKNGATSVITYFVMRDRTTNVLDTGVTIANLEMYYIEEQAAMSADVFVGAHGAATDAHTDGECIHIGQGVYRVDWPDAAFDGGIGKSVQLILVDGDSGAFSEIMEIELSPAADTVAISGDNVAADNHEDFWDNATGVTNIKATFDGTKVTVATLFSDPLTAANVNTEVDTALNTAIPGSPTADSINERIATMDGLVASNNAYWNVFVLTSGTLGATGNDATHLHLTGQAYPNDDLNDYLIVIYDNSNTRYHSVWITNWVLSTALATTTTMPFTPEASVDTYWIFNIKKDIETLASQTSFTLAIPASSDDDAYNGGNIIVRNDANDVQTCVGVIDDYTGLTRTVTLQNDPGIFTMGAGDIVTIIPLPEVTATVSITPTVGQAIADYVWDEDSSGHVTVNTFGFIMSIIGLLR
jgi:hypothetical protein